MICPRRILPALLCLLLNVPAHARLPAEVTVDLLQAYPESKKLVVHGPLSIVAPLHRNLGSGMYTVSSKNGMVIFNRAGTSIDVRATRLVVQPRSVALTIKHPAGADRRYRGTLIFQVNGRGTLLVQNRVLAKDYVKSVAGSETIPGFHIEAIKALAVLTQSRLARYKDGDPLNDTTENEAYLGQRYTNDRINEAVNAVWGRVLNFDGRPITPFYHSTCAGRTSSAAAFFGVPSGSAQASSLAYSSSVKCENCRKSPFWGATKRSISMKNFGKFFESVPCVEAKDEAGRPLRMRFADGKSTTGYQCWLRLGQKLGWDKAPGTRFEIKKYADHIQVVSTGAGHGVGLCQWGAHGLALSGKHYKEILDYYFPGTEISAEK